MNNINALKSKEPQSSVGIFKANGPGFIHIDI